MPPFYVHVEYVRDDDSNNKPQENSGADAGGNTNTNAEASNNTTPPADHPTGVNVGLIAGSVTSIAIVLFLLIVVVVPYVKKRKNAKQNNLKRISSPIGNSQFLQARRLSYNAGQRRLSLVDRLAIAQPLPPANGGSNNNSQSTDKPLSARISARLSGAFSPLFSASRKEKDVVVSPDLPMQTVPITVGRDAISPSEKFPVDVGSYDSYGDEKEGIKSGPLDETSPLSAYIEHHLQTYSATQESFAPVSAPAYTTSFQVHSPYRLSTHEHRRPDPRTPSECSSAASAYSDECESESEYGDGFHHPPPSAPPTSMYQDQRRFSARGSPPSAHSPVGDLIRSRSRNSMNLSRAPSPDVTDGRRSSSKSRPPPLPLSAEYEDFTFSTEAPAENPWDDSAPYTAAHLPLPQSAIPSAGAGGRSPQRSAGIQSPAAPPQTAALSARSARSAGIVSAGLTARSAARSPALSPGARTPNMAASIPIPLTPEIGEDEIAISPVIMSPTPEQEAFGDIPYPRSPAPRR